MVLPLALVVITACHQNASSPPRTSLPVATYAGDAACRPCHYIEFTRHRATRHAHTLRRMNTADLGSVAPPSGAIPSTHLAIQRSGPRYALVRTDANIDPDSPSSVPLDLEFGSGVSGVMYASVTGPATLVGTDYSYIPRSHKWVLGPGAGSHGPSDGIVVIDSGAGARKCVSCHGVLAQDGSLMPDARIQAVGCESCHGPSSDHVAAMHTPRHTDLKIARMGTWGALRINNACGVCHRTESDVIPQADTTRYQTFALMRSRCFKESGDSLSCLTCHNPHGDTGSVVLRSEAACRTCHTASSGSKTMSGPPAVAGKVCPVNPRDHCVACHMPRKRVFAPDEGPKVEMSDHFIRVVQRPSH